MTYGILALLIILIVPCWSYDCVGLVFYVFSGTPLCQNRCKDPTYCTKVYFPRTEKRALIVRLNEGGYKVIFQRYSDEVTTRAGEVVGGGLYRKNR